MSHETNLEDIFTELKLHNVPQMVIARFRDHCNDENYDFNSISKDIQSNKSQIQEFFIHKLNDKNINMFNILFNITNILNETETSTTQKTTKAQLKQCNQRVLLLLEGYLRSIQHDNIPLDIIYLCYRFYPITLNKFIYKPNDVLVSLEITDTQISTSNIRTIEANIKHKPFCFIPNVSPFVNSVSSSDTFSKQSYVGILSIPLRVRTNNFQYTVTIFDPFEDKDTVECHDFVQTNTFSEKYIPNSCLFCGNKHGIILQREHKLYQLKLNDLDVVLLNDDKFWFNGRHSIAKKLKMDYNDTKENIFAIECNDSRFNTTSLDRYRKDAYDKQFIKCGVYNFGEHKWTDVAPFEYNSDFSGYFVCGLCHDNDGDNVYIVTECGTTAQYCYEKNMWNTLYREVEKENINDNLMIFDDAPRIWFDPYDRNMLYCAGDQDSVVFRYFDVRDNKQRWRVVQNIAAYRYLSASRII